MAQKATKMLSILPTLAVCALLLGACTVVKIGEEEAD